jgi:glycosyltransferase involved in cell wall biosynthesis
MNQYCQRVETAPYLPFHPGHTKALMGFLSRWPRSVIDTYSLGMQKLVEQAGRKRAYDLVIASQIDMAPYVLVVPNTPKILEEVELTTLYEQSVKQRSFLRRWRNKLTWWKLSHYVTFLLQTFDGCTVVSEQERRQLLGITPGYAPIGLVPNGVDVAHPPVDFGPPEADTLIYSGALTYRANFDAVEFFLREIFPLIQAERPQVKLVITGALEDVPLHRLPRSEGVVFSGYLDDIRPTVARRWVNVVPLRVGGGTRLKILESLALGTPVVATSKGAEGLDLIPEKEILIADEPADFATAVLRLLQNPTLRETLSRNGRRAVATRYDWQTIGQQFNDFIERVVVKQKC